MRLWGIRLKEGNHAWIAKRGAQGALTLVAEHRPRVALEQVWEKLGEQQRREALQTLSRIVARQIQEPHSRKEVRYEDC